MRLIILGMGGYGRTIADVAEPIVWFIMVIPLIIKIFRMPVFEKKTV